VVAYLALFAWEAVAMTRTDKELEWT
jgi:hypothetical protein